MLKRIRQYNYICKIRKAMEETSMLRFLKLNTYRHNASIDLLNGRINENFYKAIFCGGNASNHYSEVNAENIKNYKF